MIPEDIMKTAKKAIGRRGIANHSEDSLTLAIARALLAERERATAAERERAARIAENAPMEAWATHVDIARREAYKAGVAAAIRNA